MEPWAAKYIGIPFLEKGRDRSGIDCYGLVRLVLAEQFNVDMPSYTEIYESIEEDAKVIGDTIYHAAMQWDRVESANPGDVCILRMLGHPMHCGIMADDRHMLHVIENTDSGIEDITRPHWKPRVIGMFRYAER